MKEISTLPQIEAFLRDNPCNKNFVINLVFKTLPTFSIKTFDDYVNQFLEDSGYGYIRITDKMLRSNVFKSYTTNIINYNDNESINDLLDKYSLNVDISSGVSIKGIYNNKYLILVFSHMLFDGKGVLFFMNYLANKVSHEKISFNEKYKSIEQHIEYFKEQYDRFTENELIKPWQNIKISDFIVEKNKSSHTKESEMKYIYIKLLDSNKLISLKSKLTSSTNGKNKGFLYLLTTVLSLTYKEITGINCLSGIIIHSLSATELFKSYRDVPIFDACSVPFCIEPTERFNSYTDLIIKVKNELDNFLNEAYKFLMYSIKSKDIETVQDLNNSPLLLNYRPGFKKVDDLARSLEMDTVRGGYIITREDPKGIVANVFNISVDEFSDGVYFSVSYSTINYTNKFVENFLNIYKKNFDMIVEDIKANIFTA